AALANQCKYGHVRRGAACHHADQRAFAHAAAAKDAHTLAASAGQKTIDRANSAAQRLTDRDAIQGKWSGTVEDDGMDCPIVTQPVQRISSGIDHSAEHARAHAD